MNMNFENDRMISKNALKVVALLAVCGIATFPVISQSNETDNGFDLLPLPSISATYREFHESSGTELSNARVHLSPFGMRIEQRVDDEKIAVYHNFVTGQMWFLHVDRKVVHEIPVELSEDSQSEDAVENGFNLGFIDTVPCSSLEGVERMDVRWRGRQVSLWDCYLETKEAVAMQHYDDSIGLVVRSEYVDGVVMQLEDLKFRHYEKSFFVPSNKYRVVSMNELMTGAPEIEKYRN